MPKTSVELREERATLVNQARELQKKAETENRELATDESEQFDRIMVDVDAMRAKIDRMEKLESAESDLQTPAERRSAPIGRTPGGDGATADPADVKRRRSAYRHWLKTGEVRQELRADQARGAELRDTIVSTDAKGGYLITPVEISSEIVRLIEDQVFIRKLCQQAGGVMTVTEAKKLGIRKKTVHMADADWTTEVVAVTEDTTMAFDRRDLEPFLCSKLAKASMRTLMLSNDAEAEINRELAYKFGVTEEKAFISGDGSSKPLGVYTASASGVSTGRDVTASSATAFTGDDLINLKYSLKQGYQVDPTTAWVVSREFVKRARKLKVASTTGGNDLEYIWQPGLTDGAPDRILDIPFYMSEYAPNTFTTGLYVAVLGCFRMYRIAQLADMMVQRLTELYAGTNEVGFIGRRWVDGAPILEEGFARLKLA